MPLAFLTPIFFVGLLALAAPIIVHLMHKERKEVIQFPSLMFLEKIPYKSTRRQQIHNWPLFLLRCLALILLVSAFSRPFWQRDTPLPASALGGVPREVVILLDRSYSMGVGNRWTEAVDAARDVIDGLAVVDKATLVPFDEQPGAANEATGDKGILRVALGAVTLGSERTSYAPALKVAEKIMAASTMSRREVVLISDFQKVGWDGHEEVQLPSGTTLTPVDVSGAAAAGSNVAVTTATLRRDLVGGREQLTAAARVTNTGTTKRDALNVALELNGRVVDTKTVSLAPNAAAMVTFAPALLPPGTTRGVVRAGTDSLPQDNIFNFVMAPEQAIKVLVLESPFATPAQTLYLRTALSLGENPPFRVDVQKVGAFTAADLAGHSVVVLNDAAVPSGEPGRRLREFVQQGGGLFVTLGNETSTRTWPVDAADFLPGKVGDMVDRLDGGATLASLDYGHPIFELFKAAHSGDFSGARFFRYRKLTVAGDSGILARFDDGSPALVEKVVGEGKVVVLASSIDHVWNDLPVQLVFLPFLQETMKHVGSYGGGKQWYTAGQVLDVPGYVGAELRSAGAATTGHVEVESPTGHTVRATGADTSRFLELEEQGFYTLRPSKTGAGAARELAVAVNLDLAESDLSHVDPKEMVAAVTGSGGQVAGTVTGTVLTPVEQERRQTWWWFILIGVLVALAAESWLSNQMSRATR